MRWALALLAVLAVALVPVAAASEQNPTQSELEASLVCPECHTTLDLSDAPVAQQMKEYIRKWIALGWTRSQIEDQMVADFGIGVLGVPRKSGFDLLAWVLPIGGILLGALALGAAAWYWSRNRGPGGLTPATAGPALDADLERRVDEELARFDA
jgi:cytochrome c-type biogenesis protein CcmH